MLRNASKSAAMRRSLATAAGPSIRRGIRSVRRFRRFVALAPLAALAVASGCVSPERSAHHHPVHPRMHAERETGAVPPIGATPALDLSAASTLEALIPALAERRVVFVGETHDRFDHHLIQLEIIRGLHAIHPELAIGMEAFQQPFQRHLDEYVAGALSETELLRATEYYQRWRFDFRLYQPILDFAREHRLPVVALNLPSELTRKVGRRGIEGLDEEEREQIPQEIDRSDRAYERRLEKVFEWHPKRGDRSFDRFLEVQLLWDEGMAERAALFLESRPEYSMVILTGSGHLAYGSGIPGRLVRRTQVSTAIVLNDWAGEVGPEVADYLLLPERRDLPAAGRIGALLNRDDGGLEVRSCAPGSACEAAGLEPRDEIVSIEGQPVGEMADLQLILWDKKPGDRIRLEIRRKRWRLAPRIVTREVTLQ